MRERERGGIVVFVSADAREGIGVGQRAEVVPRVNARALP